MTIKEVAMLLLRDCGITSLTPNSTLDNSNTRGVSTGDLNAVAVAITGAFQEVWEHGPSSISERRMGGVLRTQANVTLNATQYSTTISGLSPYSSWMLGCTLRINGDTGDNELLNSTTLVRPYMGASGTAITAQVWGDAIRLDSSVSHVLDPVTLPNYWQLATAVDRVDLLNTAALPVMTPRTIPAGAGTLSLIKRTGVPSKYLVEGQYEPGTAYLPIYLRVAPMPSQDFPVEFRVKLFPPVITSADIDSGDHTTDPATLIPASWVQSVLVPFARQRIASDPLYVNAANRNSVDRDYRAARAILENQRPVISATRASYT